MIEDNTLDKEYAQAKWKQAALNAANIAEHLAALGAHKSIVNRLLEPFLHVNVLTTGTTASWMNFFGLRLDRAAQPEMRVLAEAMWKVWNESKSWRLEPGQWHLPFVDSSTESQVWRYANDHDICDIEAQDLMIRISVARCARLSYLSFYTGRRSTIEEDLQLYDRLVGSSPIHASPAEHQATPDQWYDYPSGKDEHDGFTGWEHSEQAGNLGPGWLQFRKTLPNEAVAPLPEAYR